MALDLTVGGTQRVDEALGRKAFVISNEVDCAKDAVPADGIVQLINIPADYMVIGVRTQVLTPEGAALDIDVGDGSTVNKYGDALDGNAATDNLYSTVGMNASASVLQVMFKADGTDNAAQPSNVKVRVTAALIEMV